MVQFENTIYILAIFYTNYNLYSKDIQVLKAVPEINVC